MRLSMVFTSALISREQICTFKVGSIHCNLLTLDLCDSLEERVRENVKTIKESPHIREELKARTKGLIYDIKTGKLTELE